MKYLLAFLVLLGGCGEATKYTAVIQGKQLSVKHCELYDSYIYLRHHNNSREEQSCNNTRQCSCYKSK